MQKSTKILFLYIKLKQIHLNVRFACQLKTYFQLDKQLYLIDQKTQLLQGKAQNFPLFTLDLKKQKIDPQKLNSAYIEVYLQSNHGKLKILARQIHFSQLKPGENEFEHKFDNCPDKNASISYSIAYSCEIDQKPLKNNIESVPMSESQYINWGKPPQPSSGTNSIRQNLYAQSHLNPNTRLNIFIQNLQKKSVKGFSRQPKSRSKSKAIESQVVKKTNQKPQKETLLNQLQSDQKRRNSYSDIRQAKLKNSFIQKEEKESQKITIQQTRIIELNEQIKLKNEKILQTQEIIKSLNQKIKNLEVEHKKVNHENLILKSKMQRLQDKINAHKEKYEGMVLSNEYSLNRFAMKQAEYQQQMKILTEKVARNEYEKQTIMFENEKLKSQIQKIENKQSEGINMMKERQSEQLNEMMKKMGLKQQQYQQILSQNSRIRRQIETLGLKHGQKMEELRMKLEENAKLLDEIVHLKIQIEKIHSKNLFYQHTLQSHKLLDTQLTLLKEESTGKESQIFALQAQISQLKGNLRLSQQKLQRQKDSADKLKKQIKQFETNKIYLQKTIQNLNLQIQSLEAKWKNKQADLLELNKKYKDLQNNYHSIEKQLKSVHLKYQNLLKIKNEQGIELSAKNDTLRSQITSKQLRINELLTIIDQKQEIIEQVALSIQKYQQKVLKNHKINKSLQFNKLSTYDFSTQPSKFHDSQATTAILQNPVKQNKKNHLIQRLRKLNSQMVQKSEILAVKLEQTLEQKGAIQKSMNALSNSLEKLHSDAFQQHNLLKGTQLTLQDKLLTNEKLIIKLRLIINEKTQETKYLNEQLISSGNKIKNLKEENNLLSRQLNSTKQSLQDRIDEIKKLKQTIVSKEIVRSEVEAKILAKLKAVQTQYQHYKFKQLEISKTNLVKMQQLNKNLQQSMLNLQLSQQDNIQLKQVLASAKLQIQKVNTLFVDIYKQINYLEKQGSVCSFLFIPLREAVKKVEAQVAPKPIALTSSAKLDKQKLSNLKNLQGNQLRTTSNGLRTTVTSKSPQLPQPSQLIKSPQSKLSTISKNSIQKRDRFKSKDSQKT